MGRLADTPEYQTATKSTKGRARRSNAPRPAREAARSASESIQQNAKDERSRVPVPKVEIPVPEKAKIQKAPPLIKAPDMQRVNLESRGGKRKRPERKNSIPDNKKIREQIEKDHGWTGDGEPQKRSILKPVIFFYFSNTYL